MREMLEEYGGAVTIAIIGLIVIGAFIEILDKVSALQLSISSVYNILAVAKADIAQTGSGKR